MTPTIRRLGHRATPSRVTAVDAPPLPARLRRVVTALVLLVATVLSALAVVGGAPGAPTAGAALPAQATTTTPDTAPLGTSGQPRSIPLPNSGQEPTDSGERGGALQEAIFFGICGVILGGVGLVWWESRRKRRAQGRLPARR